MWIFKGTWKIFESWIIEGIFVNGLAWRGSEVVGEVLKTQQTGRIQNYILLMITAFGLAIAWFIFK